MALTDVAEPDADPIDPLTGWLDDVLAGLADGVADCSRDGSGVPDAVLIDRIALLEKIKAAATALQMAESVRFAQSQAELQLAADVHPRQDRPRDRRPVGPGLQNLRVCRGAAARDGAGVVVRAARNLPAARHWRGQ